MAMLNFKYGLYENLPVASTETTGSIFVTSDEQAMYVDLPDSNSGVKRIRLGDVIIFENARVAKPPFSDKAIYYFAEENALLRWKPNSEDKTTGSWTQINSISDATAAVQAVQDNLTAEIDRATKAEAKAYADAKSYVDAYIETNNKAVSDVSEVANKAAEDAGKAQSTADNAAGAAGAAQEAAGKAQGTADAAKALAEGALLRTGGQMTGNIEMTENSTITGIKTPALESDAVNKKYVDDIKTSLSGQIGVNTGALAAQSEAIGKAQGRADEAYNLAYSKTTLAEVQQQDYATKTEARGYANAVLGGSGDTAASYTVYGAHKAAAAAAAAAEAASGVANAAIPKSNGSATGLKVTSSITEETHVTTKAYVDTAIANKIGLSDAMVFKGVLTSATYEAGTIFNQGDTYKVGADFVYKTEGEGESKVEYRCYVGDLLIHNGGDNKTTPTWVHVSSGYEDDYNQILGLDQTNNKLFLTNGIDNEANSEIGSVVFSSAVENIVITPTSSGNNHTLSFSLVWGTFDPPAASGDNNSQS